MTALTEADFVRAATLLRCDVAAVIAVCEVEAPRGGFNPDGTVATLFEGHKFYQYTKGAFAATHPTLCFPAWTRAHYGKTWLDERERLRQAMRLNPTAALMSASWGRFQIMGFNFAACGYADVQAFVDAMASGEAAQLDAFCAFVMERGLDDELRRRDWAGFARGYNGPRYRDNHYHTRLAAAYRRAGGVTPAVQP